MFTATRKLITDFVVVFLLGAVVGGLVMWSYQDTQLTSFMSRSNNPEVLVARINEKYARDYHLSPEEIQRAQPLIREMAQHIYQFRHQFGVDIISTLDRYHAQIADQLNPEHKAAYQAIMADRHKKMSTLLLLDPGSPTADSK
jgi:hypothetical protein